MQIHWWHLPGPARFIDAVTRDLRNGSNVMVCVPEIIPPGLESALRTALPEDDSSRWAALDLADVMTDPTTYLIDRFYPTVDPTAIFSTQLLLESPTFSGRILLLNGITDQNWPDWKQFLQEYAHICRGQSLINRTVFCVPLKRTVALEPPTEDLCLRLHMWRGMVDTFDMMVYVADLFRDCDMMPKQRRLAVSIAANLAVWDPILAGRFASEDLGCLLNPIPALLEIAQTRHWIWDEHRENQRAWSQGKADVFESKWELHSAFVCLGPISSSIERRLWNAQIGVMLPLVEEHRQNILSTAKSFLTVPFQTRFGEVIEDYRDLEIGHIEAQLSNSPVRVDPHLRRLVSNMRDIRNRLSHMEILPPEIALYEELWRDEQV